LPKSASNKPFSLWEAHPTFWNDSGFVRWQLLRRNRAYQKLVKCFSDPSRPHLVFVPRRSYPPSPGESFERWRQRNELFFGLLKDRESVQEFKGKLVGNKAGWFKEWVDRKEFQLEVPYEDLYFGQFLRPNVNLRETEGYCRAEKKFRGYLPIAEESFSELGIRTVQAYFLKTLDSLTPGSKKTLTLPTFYMQPNSSQDTIRFFIVDEKIDFPPLTFLPQVTRNIPNPHDRKVYSTYLYDQRFNSFSTGRGRPLKIMEALRVWVMSRKDKMKDSDIARTLFGLKYSYPDKPSNLQRVHDLKETARKAIEGTLPKATYVIYKAFFTQKK